MLALVRRYVRNGRKYVSAMGSRTLDAVSVIDPSFSCFMVDIEVLEVVIEVDGTSAEVSAEQGGMRCKYCRYVDMALTTERDSEASLPFMEMGNDGGVKLTRDVL